MLSHCFPTVTSTLEVACRANHMPAYLGEVGPTRAICAAGGGRSGGQTRLNRFIEHAAAAAGEGLSPTGSNLSERLPAGEPPTLHTTQYCSALLHISCDPALCHRLQFRCLWSC